MPIILVDASQVRKSLRDQVEITSVATPASPKFIEVNGEKKSVTLLSHVTNISPKKGISSYRQDLLTSQK